MTEKEPEIDLRSLFTVEAEATRFNFTPTDKGRYFGHIGYVVDYSECDTEEDAWIAIYKAFKKQNLIPTP